MATVYQPDTRFSIRWEDYPIENDQTLGNEFKSDIQKIGREYNQDAIWIRQNGEEMYMTDMNDQHIINALRMCKRNMEDPMTQSERYEYLLLEAIQRGLMQKDIGEWDAEENNL